MNLSGAFSNEFNALFSQYTECPNCGNNIADDELKGGKYCPKCGTNLVNDD